MQRIVFLLAVGICAVIASASTGNAEGLVRSQTRFYYKNPGGQVGSAPVIRRYYGRTRMIPVVHPSATVDPRIDPKLRRAATIAQERANARTKARCWRYVKQALVAAGVVDSYPKTNYAFQAGTELVQNYGFKKLPMRDPYAAPVGAVIVYGKGSNGAGHVEIRTKNGFVSDYHSKNRCFYPVIAVYGKFSS